MRYNIFKHILKPYQEDDDYKSLMEVCEKLTEVIKKLEEKITVLEQENISTTNELYRLENSLDARIDILAQECGCINDV
jgi:predicted  nucleic acid-binding Zn-ribbon protein